MMPTTYTTALTIAGSDPGGGAGIQADLKTFAALGCYGLSVITALTAQNTQGVQGIQTIPESFVSLQLQSLFQDIAIGAAKTGMLHHTEMIKAVTHFFDKRPCPLIVDPVMTAKDGSLLLKSDAITALKEYLLPMATLLTPNLPEAEHLLQRSINNVKEMEQAAKLLAEMGPQSVLIKGGHLAVSESSDCLYNRVSQEIIWLKAPRIMTPNTHGTGCTLSAAITALLAKGISLNQAVEQAKAYLSAALKAGADYSLGQGHGPVHHFYQFWKSP
jgi:hydroxymethylpyrimidine/phosphomethylpyrimidine kinase